MAKVTRINHATLVVDDLAAAADFYRDQLGLEPLPAFDLDFPAQFFRVNDTQQLHVTEWEDTPSFRGHVCFEVDDFNVIFDRAKALGVIDVRPWGKVRRLPDGAMQMFIRDPAGNLVEITCPPDYPVADRVFADELAESGDGILYKSGREDGRGDRGEGASLYHED
ncbi:MAG: VOC family protein [Phycisphaerales bacterium]|nr:VOC family protein [Phycisphaerales bacterium]